MITTNPHASWSPAARLRALRDGLADVLIRDRHVLRRDLSRLEDAARRGALREDALAHLEGRLLASAQAVRERRSNLPVARFPNALPVVERRDEIARAIAEHQVVVICGATGSGKSTQLPKICLALGRGAAGMIGHTQPRRIAARSLAARLAEELSSPLGERVGYKIRFTNRVGPSVFVKVMTDGMLLAEIQGDRFLEQYDTIILDEAHERSLNIDFLLGYLKRLLPRRADLKLVITSATIDPQRFSTHFGGCPVIEVSGRTYPVEVRYRPLRSEGTDRDREQGVVEAVEELSRCGPGDVLVFLPGERDIRDTAEALRKHHPPHTELVPLYARLSAAEQHRVFEPHDRRRIVLATNVAETSLTVPGIRYVVDSGEARVSRYSPRAKVQRLPVEKISQASANQRSGRCGRVSAGVCIRLYAEEDYLTRPAFTDPEILRSHLASVILQMKSLGLGDIERFPFVEPPDPRLVKDGYQTLVELAAVDEAGRLTDIGRQLARLPVDPRLGRMVLAAAEQDCLAEVLVIAAALSVQDPRERPLEAQAQADEVHRRHQDPRSDFLTYLRLWQTYHDLSKHLSKNKLRQHCRDNFLSYLRMREWQDVHQQLHALVKDMGFRENPVAAGYEAIHRALLTGLLSNVAVRTGDREYTGVRNMKLAVHPASTLFRRGPKWLVAAELVETGRLYARTVAAIEPEWIEIQGAHLVKRRYFEPHWEKKPAQVVAYESVTLFGLPVVARRRVAYGPIAPDEARELFIRHALVRGEYDTREPFLAYNRALLAEIEAIEAKARRRDVLVEEDEVFRFYDRRIPAGICSGATFQEWCRNVGGDDSKALLMRREDFMQHWAPEVTVDQFPDAIRVRGMSLPLEYRFEPGEPDDGVTVVVPVAALNQLTSQDFDWLVPGLIRDRVIALLRTLPKSLRRHFIPAPEFADACLQSVDPGAGPLPEGLSRELRRITGVQVPAHAWQPAAVPAHLRMNFRLVDGKGAVVAGGRDLSELQSRLGESAAESFSALAPSVSLEREGLTTWDIGTIPESVQVRRRGIHVTGYPALLDRGDSVALRVVDSPQHALALTKTGLRRLFLLQLPGRGRYLERSLSGVEKMCLDYAAVGTCAEFKQDLLAAVLDRAFQIDPSIVRDAASFSSHLEEGRQCLGLVSNELCALVGQILEDHRRVQTRLSQLTSAVYREAVADVREQVSHLVYSGFILSTPGEWMPHLPRYLKAVLVRLDRLEAQPAKDRPRAEQIRPFWQEWRLREERRRKQGVDDAELQRYRWMLEELRVSLFAQQLKTSVPVSAQRLRQQLERLAG